MEAFGTQFVVEPGATATALGFVFGGVALGTVSGLVPGVHVNNLALLLASLAATVPGPPELVGAAILAAGWSTLFSTSCRRWRSASPTR